MKSGLVVGILLVLCWVAYAQNTTSHSASDYNRPLAEIRKLKEQILRLKMDIADQRDKLAALERQVPPALLSSEMAVYPRVPRVLNFSREEDGMGTCVIDCGKEGFREGDKVVFIHRQNQTLTKVGEGQITRVYPRDSTCEMQAGNSIEPLDEVYVSNRCHSPYSIAWMQP
jgi:hypothetical protein